MMAEDSADFFLASSAGTPLFNLKAGTAAEKENWKNLIYPTKERVVPTTWAT
jgi:hypothetical protein